MTPTPAGYSPPTALVQAVSSLGERVTVGDVAAQSGLNVLTVERELLNLATAVNGHLEVTQEGSLVYRFPPNLQGALAQRFWQIRARQAWQALGRILFYLVRMSFGIILLVSILLIFLTILIILTASSNRDRDDDRGGQGLSMPLFMVWPRLDLWWLGWDAAPRPSRTETGRPGLNFLEAVFSFLFGDGNPNWDLEDRRWQYLGTCIRRLGGAVSAEQLLPYWDQEQGRDGADDAILPVLVRFNGRPEVTPEGQLVYTFAELQVTAQDSPTTSIPGYLRELPWRFTQASSNQVLLVIGLGGLNLVGGLILGNLLGDGGIALQLGGLVAWVQGIYGLLMAYAVGFFVIPLARYFWIQRLNRQIEARNQQRQACLEILQTPDAVLAEKLAYARGLAQARRLDPQDVVYTTGEDLLSQELPSPVIPPTE